LERDVALRRASGVRPAAVIVPGRVLGVLLDYVAILMMFPLRRQVTPGLVNERFAWMGQVLQHEAHEHVIEAIGREAD
jgi:hypothetical protein